MLWRRDKGCTSEVESLCSYTSLFRYDHSLVAFFPSLFIECVFSESSEYTEGVLLCETEWLELLCVFSFGGSSCAAAVTAQLPSSSPLWLLVLRWHGRQHAAAT